MPVTAISDQHLLWLIDSGTRCEEDMVAGVPDLDGRLPLCFYSTISRRAVSSTWADKYLIYQTLSGALDWLQLSKMHMLLQPPNTHLSVPVVILPSVLSAECLICFHYAACTIPILPSSVRAILQPNSPSNLEDASASMNVGHKSWHVIYGLFYSISSLIPPREPLLPRNHNPQTTTEGSVEFGAAISAK